nr:putative ariadne-like ring finger protein [Quercus suber]
MHTDECTPVYDLLFLVDATASMGTYLKALRRSLPQVISLSALTNCFERIGVLAYRDYNDKDLLEWSGWSCNNDQEQPDLIGMVSNLIATGGGDAPEAVKTGLAKAYEVMRPEATTLILLYTDAHPHFRWEDAASSNTRQEHDALSCSSSYNGYGSHFVDWVSAARILRHGEKKAQIITMLATYPTFSGGYYEYLATITRGICMHLNEPSSEEIAQVTMETLLSWMNVHKPNVDERTCLPAMLVLYKDVSDIASSIYETDRSAHKYLYIKPRDSGAVFDRQALSVSVLNTHLPGMQRMMQDFAKTYRENDKYRSFVTKQLYAIIEYDVTAMSLNPVFGSLWRAVCDDRENAQRQLLLNLFGRRIDEQKNVQVRNRLKLWLEESYNFTAEVVETIANVSENMRFPCVYLDPTLDHSGIYEKQEGNQTGNSATLPWTRDELLEIGRSCDRRILQKLSHVLTRLTYVNSAGDLPAHIAATSNAEVPRLPMALIFPEYKHKFWRLLLHLVIPGTVLSGRPAALLAALSIRVGIQPLSEVAALELLRWRDKWNDLKSPETWNVNCLSLLLDADRTWREQHSSVIDAKAPPDPSLLLESDRQLFERLIEYRMLEMNLGTTLDAKIGWTPERVTMPVGPTVLCRSCGYHRSVTIMGADHMCGLCLADLEYPETEQLSKGTRASRIKNPMFDAVWYECVSRSCHSQYVVYNVERQRVRPKCHFCRSGNGVKARAPFVECTMCLSRVIWPEEYRPQDMSQWTCIACNMSKETIVSVQTTASEIRAESGIGWLIDDKSEDVIDPFQSRSLYHTAVHLKSLDDFCELVQLLPARSAPHPPLVVRGKVIRNSVELCDQLYSWLQRRRTESGTCSLCFNDRLRKIDLLPACGRSGCTQHVCQGCSRSWYGLNAVGRLVNMAALACPFCRRAPTTKTLARYGVRIDGVSGFRDAIARGGEWLFAWCVCCGITKPYMERVCAHGAPAEFKDWNCVGCREAMVGQVQRLYKPCPGCGISTEKISGCNHVQCVVVGCGVHWCYVCGLQQSEDRVYQHLAEEHGEAELGEYD